MHVTLRAKLLAVGGALVAGGDAYRPPTIGGGRAGERAAGGGGGGGERKRSGARELFGGDASSVVLEAFDENGTSLGYSHDAASDWSRSQVILSEDITGGVPFMYHANASYYMVGSNGTVVEFWHPFDEEQGGKDMASIHLNVAANMVAKHCENGQETIRIKVVNAGWTGVANGAICEGDGGCPALVLAGTTHIASRRVGGDTLSLNGFLADWALEQGWVLTDDFIKYFYYDFNFDGDWMAVPLVSDIRILAYNKTTFETYGIPTPPGTESTKRWKWEQFVQTAEDLTLATGRPGWYFKGSWDEETKMSLMIARNWGTTLYTENDAAVKTCALGEKFVDAMNSTVEVMLREGWMSREFIPTDTDAFQTWEEDGLPLTESMEPSPFLGVDPPFSYNSSELWGMAIVPPVTLNEILESGDIAEAFVPGRYSFLGGCGLFITKTTTDEQQGYAWELMKDMIDKASVYAVVQRSPPPYESALKDDMWASDQWALAVKQLRESVPAQYPQPSFAKFRMLENIKPFREMWMEMAYKNSTAADAFVRLETTVNSILKIRCTQQNYLHESCRRCTKTDYNYTVSPCDPATQTIDITFAYDPRESSCYGGRRMPNATTLQCDHVMVSSPFGVAIIVVSSMGGALAIFSAILVYLYRRRPMIKFSQPRFCVLFSLGVAGLCLSNLSLLGTNTSSSCFNRVALWSISFDLTFGALFSKAYRVRTVLLNAMSGRKKARRSLLSVVAVVSLAVVVDVVILALWSIFDHHGPSNTTVQVGRTGAVVNFSHCASEASPWALAFVAFKIVLITWGVYLAWVTRKINYALVEGRQISWSIYLFGVLAAILLLIGSSGLRVEYWVLTKAVVLCLSGCTALVMVLIPKLWAAHRGLEVDRAVLTSAATTLAMRGGSVESYDTANSFEGEHGGDVPCTVICSHCHRETDVNHSGPGGGGGGGGGGVGGGGGGGGGGAAAAAGRQVAGKKKRKRVAGPCLNFPLFPNESSGDLSVGAGGIDAGKKGDRFGAGHALSSVTPSTDPEGGGGGVHLGRSGGGVDTRQLLSLSRGTFTSNENGTPSSDSRSSACDQTSSRTESEDDVGGLKLAFSNAGGGGLGDRFRAMPPLAYGWKGATASSSSPSSSPFSAKKVGPALALALAPAASATAALAAPAAAPALALAPSPATSLEGNQVASGAGLAAVTEGWAPKKDSWRGSWRSSWRRSNESAISSSSGRSELDAASFRRSVQAQAMALRAALWSNSSGSRGADRQSDGLASRVSGVSGISGTRDSEEGCGTTSSSRDFPGRWFGPPAPKLQAPPNAGPQAAAAAVGGAAQPPRPVPVPPGPEGVYVPTHVRAHTSLRPTQGGFANGFVSGSANGFINGFSNGSANGFANGSANGFVNGPANGLTNGFVNGSANGFANGCGCRNDREGEMEVQVPSARPPPPPRSRPRPLVVTGGGGGGGRQMPSDRWPEQQFDEVNRSPCVVSIGVPLASGPRGAAAACFGASPPVSSTTASIGMSSAASSSSLESVDLAATPEGGAATTALAPAGDC